MHSRCHTHACPPPAAGARHAAGLTAASAVQIGSTWTLEDLQVVCGTMGMPTATLKLRGPDGMLRVRSAIGTGPVDAAYKAVDSVVAVPAKLTDYSITSVTEGIEALAATRVRTALRPLPPHATVVPA